MLVLTRKKGEKVWIADTIEVTVLEVRGDKVRLGIFAPAEMPIHREEVFQRIQKADGDDQKAA